MSGSKYGKYIVQQPKVMHMAYHDFANVTGRTWPQRVYLDNDLVKGCPLTVEIGWVWEMSEPAISLEEHSHSNDEILLKIGTDYKNPDDLGGEVEFNLGGETYTMTKTHAIYIPRGVKHAPFITKRVDTPRINIAITLGNYD